MKPIFKRYHIFDADKLEYEGVYCGNLKLFKHMLLIVFAFALSVAANIEQMVLCKQKLGEVREECTIKIVTSTDSLVYVIDSLQTINEMNKLHYLIGKISIERSGKKPHQPTTEEVLSFVRECGAWYPDLITAQAIVESGCGRTSPQGTNNLFGMKIPQRRETTAVNVHSGDTYAKYKDWRLSVVDRVLYDYFVFKGHKPTREKYITQMSDNYAEDVDYKGKILHAVGTLKGK